MAGTTIKGTVVSVIQERLRINNISILLTGKGSISRWEWKSQGGKMHLPINFSKYEE